MNERDNIRLQNWEKARFAPKPEGELYPFQPTQIDMAPLRDGLRIYTEIFLPDNKGCHPVILHRSP